MFFEVTEEYDDGSIDEAQPVLPTNRTTSSREWCQLDPTFMESPIRANATILTRMVALSLQWLMTTFNVWMCYTAADDDEAHMVKSLNIAGCHCHIWQFSSSSRRDTTSSNGGFFVNFGL